MYAWRRLGNCIVVFTPYCIQQNMNWNQMPNARAHLLPEADAT
jgi:hypothetical protein